MTVASELNKDASRTIFLQPEQDHWLRRVTPRVNAIHAGHLPSGYLAPDRIAFDHELIIVLSGSMRLTLGGLPVDCHGGDMIISPPGVVHSFLVLAGPLQRVCVHFDWDRQHASGPLMPYRKLDEGPIDHAWIKPTPAWVGLPLPMIRHRPGEQVWKLGLEIAAEIDRAGDVGRASRLDGRLLILLAELATTQDDCSASRPSPVAWVKEQIDRGFTGDIHFASLAKEMHVAASQLSRAFKRQYGITPTAYLLEQRLMEAMRRLRAGEDDMVAVASACGFHDPNYFSRMFSRRWGVPPSQITPEQVD